MYTHLDNRPTIILNDIRDGYNIIVTGHEDCKLYALTEELYDCGCKVTRERDCDGAITMNRCDDCEAHYNEPRIIITHEV